MYVGCGGGGGGGVVTGVVTGVEVGFDATLIGVDVDFDVGSNVATVVSAGAGCTVGPLVFAIAVGVGVMTSMIVVGGAAVCFDGPWLRSRMKTDAPIAAAAITAMPMMSGVRDGRGAEYVPPQFAAGDWPITVAGMFMLVIGTAPIMGCD